MEDFINAKEKARADALTPAGFGKTPPNVKKPRRARRPIPRLVPQVETPIPPATELGKQAQPSHGYKIIVPKGSKAMSKKMKAFILSQHQAGPKDGPPLEDWEYLLHHIHEDKGKEVIHHCQLMDHLGNLYELDHMEDKKGRTFHAITGVVEDQKVIWNDEEAKENGLKTPCPGRQL
jgi:hypothetical protein